jgi:hypothetical protein
MAMTALAVQRRGVPSRLELEVSDLTQFAMAAAVARDLPVAVETIEITLDGAAIEPKLSTTCTAGGSTSLRRDPACFRSNYAATVIGRASPAPVTALDETL